MDTKAGRSRARINFSRVLLDNKQEKLLQVVSAAKEISIDEWILIYIFVVFVFMALCCVDIAGLNNYLSDSTSLLLKLSKWLFDNINTQDKSTEFR